MQAKLVRDIMISEPTTASPDDSLGVAGRTLLDSGQKTLPIVDETGEICGIITDRDLRLAADSPLLDEAPAEILENLQKHKVREIMTTAVHSIEAEAHIMEAAQLMRVANVAGLPVVEYDETGNHERLVGLVTRSMLLDYLILLLEARGDGEEPEVEGTEGEEIEGEAL